MYGLALCLPGVGQPRGLPVLHEILKTLWAFRGLIPDVRAGLVPARCGATTRVARTPRNSEDPRLLVDEPITYETQTPDYHPAAANHSSVVLAPR